VGFGGRKAWLCRVVVVVVKAWVRIDGEGKGTATSSSWNGGRAPEEFKCTVSMTTVSLLSQCDKCCGGRKMWLM